VTDTGIGIPEKMQQQIFSPFTQADGSTTRRYGGTGLGLTIASRLVEMMGGRIWLDSHPGRGSTFHFTARFGLAQASAKHSAGERPLALEGLPVLVVDDNATNRRILGETLKRWGMQPTVVENAEAALAAMQRAADNGGQFPLALLDVHMPETDGFCLAERIKQIPALAGVTILMLSSADHSDARSRCRAAGVAGYLTKPLIQSDLWEGILNVLGPLTPERRRSTPITQQAAWEARRRLRVLLAEDNLVNQRLAMRILEKWGHSVVVAGNGKQAMTSLAEAGIQGFDLVLMDVQMPEMNGFEATAAIREMERSTGSHLPILAMTAHAMKGDRERCLEAGMDGYVAKPIQAHELFEAIESLASLLAPTGLDGAGHPGSPPSTPDPQIDREAILGRVGGDVALLQETAGIFLEELPRLREALRAALAAGDGASLERAAHSLKGSVGLFGAASTVDAARSLERLGQTGNLAQAAAAYVTLEAYLDRLTPAIADLCTTEAVGRA